MPYGAPELKAVARSFMLRATASASLLWLSLFAALVIFAWLVPPVPGRNVPVDPGRVIIPIDEPVAPRVIEEKQHTRITPDRGVIVPVHDKVELPEIIQAPPFDGGVETEGSFSDAVGDATRQSEGAVEPPPPLRTEFRFYDREPVAIIHKAPEYPDIAKQAGVEGRVVIALLIDRTGHVREAVVERSVPMLDDAVIEATRRWVFEPALIDNRPVMAWVRVPVEFRLH
jgi:TonB family protein